MYFQNIGGTYTPVTVIFTGGVPLRRVPVRGRCISSHGTLDHLGTASPYQLFTYVG